ncbi:MAG: hypothetical protein ACREGE_02615 [Candidatus Microsaccharimonas sp.]
MQQQGMSRKNAALILLGGLALLVGLIALITIFTQKDENQFGKFIRIQNYDTKVKNVSSDVRDGIESYLYNVVVKNIDSSVDASNINDATIRDDSDIQEYDTATTIYSGSFIVDMASIKQSYNVQYSYSSDEAANIGGNPIVVSCLPKEKLIYGEFTCTDLVSEQATASDVLLQYLPYENFTFEITPDATQGDALVLVVSLDIAEVDLKGNAASNAEIVAMYKKEVTDWISSKGVDPTKYEIQYNYDDAGNLIRDDNQPRS